MGIGLFTFQQPIVRTVTLCVNLLAFTAILERIIPQVLEKAKRICTGATWLLFLFFIFIFCVLSSLNDNLSSLYLDDICESIVVEQEPRHCWYWCKVPMQLRCPLELGQLDFGHLDFINLHILYYISSQLNVFVQKELSVSEIIGVFLGGNRTIPNLWDLCTLIPNLFFWHTHSQVCYIRRSVDSVVLLF